MVGTLAVPGHTVALGIQRPHQLHARLNRKWQASLWGASAMTAGPPLLILGLVEPATWRPVEMLYAALPGLAVLIMVVITASMWRSLKTMALLQQLVTSEVQPALAMTGVLVCPSEAITFITRGATTLDPELNLYRAHNLTLATDTAGQLLGVLDTSTNIIEKEADTP